MRDLKNLDVIAPEYEKLCEKCENVKWTCIDTWHNYDHNHTYVYQCLLCKHEQDLEIDNEPEYEDLDR